MSAIIRKYPALSLGVLAMVLGVAPLVAVNAGLLPKGLPSKMRRFLIGIAIAVVATGSAYAQLSQSPVRVSTRFGVLSVDKELTLVFNGRPVQPTVVGNNGLHVGTPYQIGASDVVLVTNNGGTGCPTLYYFVTVTAKRAKATRAFGTCADLTRVVRTKDALALHMPGFRGPFEPERDRERAARERHVFVYRGGGVTENGRPVK